jgi:phytanoyl-CoA hydroxylase
MGHRGPHELNETFVWQRPRGPFVRLTEDQIESYDRAGFFVVPDAFAADAVGAIVAEIDEVEARLAAVLSRRKQHRVPPTDFTITANLAQRSPALREVCATGVLADIAFDLVGPAPRLCWDQAVYKKPHAQRTFPWHQDNGQLFIEPQQYITCWLALTDATEENGCPVIALGVDTVGTLRHWDSEAGLTCFDGPVEATPVPLKAGSVAVFSSVTTHMTGGNQTDATRKAYVVQYMADGSVSKQRRDDGSIVTTVLDADDRYFRTRTPARAARS